MDQTVRSWFMPVCLKNSDVSRTVPLSRNVIARRLVTVDQPNGKEARRRHDLHVETIGTHLFFDSLHYTMYSCVYIASPMTRQ